jgi:hypothetical protein
MSPARLVFVDETGAATNMARRYGRSSRGKRLDGPIPHGHWKTTTFVGGLTTRGFIAPYVLDGPMNGAIFLAPRRSSDRRSCGIGSPALRTMGRADARPRAQAGRHRGEGQSRRPQGRGHRAGDHRPRRRTALPAALLARPEPIRRGAPDPIPKDRRPQGGGGEQAFAKLKALLRKAAERTVDGWWNAIGQLLVLFPPAECANYLANSGYPRSA